jgi:hypothetical protein
MHTSMNVTGRPAQFGRGVMVEVGGKLVTQFAANLAQLITGDTGGGDAGGESPAEEGDPGGKTSAAAAVVAAHGTSAPAATAEAPSGNGSAAASPAARPVASTANGSAASAPAPAQEDSLNLIKLVGPALLKRLVPVAVGAVGLAVVGRIVWRLRRRRAGKA